MEEWKIQISPRRVCECGKTILQLSAKEKDAYNEFALRIEERSKKEGEEEKKTISSEAQSE